MLLGTSLFLIASTVGTVHGQTAELLSEYPFESGSGSLIGWGAGYQGEYQEVARWKDPFTVSLDSEKSHSGEEALRVEITAVPASLVLINSPGISFPERDTERRVKIRFFVRTQDIPAEGLTFSVLEKEQDGKVIQYLGGQKTLADIPPSPEWHEVAAEGTLNASTKMLVLLFSINADHVPSYLWIDDISVEAVPSP